MKFSIYTDWRRARGGSARAALPAAFTPKSTSSMQIRSTRRSPRPLVQFARPRTTPRRRSRLRKADLRTDAHVVLAADVGNLGSGVSVIAELKRRNVFRVAALYLVAAWVLLQVGDLLFGLLVLPTWTNKLLFAALVLGFVPALIFSWVYELTPEGLKREHEVERNASITAETARKLDLIVVALLVVAIVVVAVERFTPRSAPTTDAASDASSAEAPVQAGAKSIAVLPFVNMSS